MTGKCSSSPKSEPLYVLPEWYMNEDIVISGMSGRFPESENVEQLKQNLYNGVDMVTEDDRRWNRGLFNSPKGFGKLPDLEHFDAVFFGVHGRMAASMDPAQRILLEVAYETIFDAGIDPLSLNGRNIGVYVGSSGSTVPQVKSDLDDLYTGYEALGNSPAMMSNRVSYTLDVTGPSFTLDTGCSSSMYAVNEAVVAMRAGQCEAAVVAGCTLLDFYHTVQLNNTSVLSVDSRCKAYDKDANGFVRSEGIAAVFLQKASEAKRCYVTVLNCKVNNDGRKVEGIMFPSAPRQSALIASTYAEIKMDPRNIVFLEAHGTGNMTGDKEEGRCIGEVFCPNKDDRILVASIKSNIGHTEASSGVCSLIKVILTCETGMIAANLNYKSPNPDVKALVEGRMIIVDKHLPFQGGIVGVSNFGFGGGNAHLIVKSHDKEPQHSAKGRNVPRVVTACGSTQQAVQFILDTVRQKEFSDEGIVLLEEASRTTPTKMRYRGFTLFGNNGPEPDVIQQCSGDPRPLWFLYSGMGSQWSGMGKQLMKLKPFANSIRESAEVLRPFGIDLIHLLTEATEDELNHILYPFVTIAAVQIALTDMLRSLGLKPDGIIGHSVGELGCAYADGTFTAKQMLLCSYWRGKSCVLSQLINGRMAAIGMTWQEAKRRCPAGVFPVCHNSQDSVTISGPTEMVEPFVQQLQKENVFARIVKTGEIAFHSKYVEPASIIMRKELEKVIPNPVKRSPLWVCSSVPEEDWDKPSAKYSSVDYHINNLLSPVLFNEAMTKVPKDALIIEIAPHCLLQPIVKRILGPKAVYVGLCNKNKPDNLRTFLGAIGSLYNSGLNPEIKNLYEPVTFPVPRGTPMLNSLIKWDRIHWKTWTVRESQQLKDQVTVDTIQGGRYEYIMDHKLDGRVMYTAPGYLWLAWKCLAKILLTDMDDLSVMFENVILHRAAVLPKNGIFIFNVKVRDSDGSFNILEGGSLVASGKISRIEDEERKSDIIKESSGEFNEEVFTMDAKSFYRELRLRGYEYSKSYQCLVNCDSNGLNSVVQWKGNWVTFIESVLQIALTHQSVRALALVTQIRKVKIFPKNRPRHEGETLHVTFNPNAERVESSTVEVQGLEVSLAPRRLLKHGKPAIEEQLFLPYIDNRALTEQEYATMKEYSQICSTVARRALKATSNTSVPSSLLEESQQASETLVDKYLQANDSKQVLLHALHKTQENGKVPEISNSELSRDLISSACLSERSLRACLDCFLINVGSTKFNIVEISNDSIIYPAVDRSLRFTYYGHIVTEITLARTAQQPIPSDLSPSASVITLSADNPSLPEGTDLVVAKDIFTTKALSLASTLNAVSKSLKNNGFFLLSERTCFTPAEKCMSLLTGSNMQEQNERELEAAFQSAGFVLVCKKKDDATFVTYLLRKINRSIKKNQRIFRVIEDSTFTWIEDLKVIMKQNEEAGVQETVWIVDERLDSGICGMMQSIMKEVGGAKFRVYCNTSLNPNEKAPKFNLDSAEIQDIVEKDLKFNCYRDGQWGMFISQIAPKEPSSQQSQCCYLNVTDRGDLSSLRWIQSNQEEFDAQLDDAVVKVNAVYCGVNSRDVQMAMGKIAISIDKDTMMNPESRIGMEFSGVECKTARRVMGLVPCRGIANVIVCQTDLTFDVPINWSLQDAATVPLAYLTAYYALCDKARLERGETILVHSGAGEVGTAVITIALSRSCKVFATVDSIVEKNYLLELFPVMKGSNVIDTTTENFEEEIMNLTSKNGVDVVLNSSSDKLTASIRILKRNGRYVDIGREGSVTDPQIGSAIFAKNVGFQGVHMPTLLMPKYQNKLKVASDMLRDGIKNGVVKPLKRAVFSADKTVEAFRYLEAGNHIGRVLIRICEETHIAPGRNIAPATLKALPKLNFSPKKSVVVTGGLGGMGFELILWLVEKGVTKVVISSRSGLKNDYQRFWMQKWKKAGLQVKLCHEDIATNSGCRALLTEANKLGPVGAIFHLAVVLRDGLLENLTPQDYVDVAKVKVIGTRNLDLCSRDLCPELEHFVGASSILTSRGVGGLGNYCYGNAVIERICELRHRQGLPGLAIEWGAIGDAGIYFEEFGEDSTRHYDLRGSIPLITAACFLIMERFMLQNQPVTSYFARADESEKEGSLKKDLLAVMCNILGVSDRSSLHDDTTLGSMGMDSLMVVEAKQLLDTDYNTSLSIPEVLKLSIQDLKNLSVKGDAA